MLPSTYRPKQLSDFIGPARKQAEFIERLTKAAMGNGDPVTVLILGKPGIGKSALSDWFCQCLNVNKWSIRKYNGTDINVDVAREIANGLHYRDMFSSYRILRIEEVDKVPTVAQVRLLSLLDDLPPQSGVVANSNCDLAELEERFQRRFNVIELKPPSSEDIFTLLRTQWPQIREQIARQIAEFSCGNVGAALKDADGAIVG